MMISHDLESFKYLKGLLVDDAFEDRLRGYHTNETNVLRAEKLLVCVFERGHLSFDSAVPQLHLYIRL